MGPASPVRTKGDFHCTFVFQQLACPDVAMVEWLWGISVTVKSQQFGNGGIGGLECSLAWGIKRNMFWESLGKSTENCGGGGPRSRVARFALGFARFSLGFPSVLLGFPEVLLGFPEVLAGLPQV